MSTWTRERSTRSEPSSSASGTPTGGARACPDASVARGRRRSSSARPQRDGEPAAERVPGAPATLRCSTDLAADPAHGPARRRRGRDRDAARRTSCRSSRRSPRAACRSSARPRTSPSSARAIHRRRRDIIGLADTHRIPIVATGANPGLRARPLAADADRPGLGRRAAAGAAHGRRERLRSARPGVARDRPDAGRRSAPGIADGSVVGHAGFPGEPAHPGDEPWAASSSAIEVVSEPILATAPLTLADGSVIATGRTAGADQRATGWFDGRAVARHLDDPPRRPSVGRAEPTDEIQIEGVMACTSRGSGLPRPPLDGGDDRQRDSRGRSPRRPACTAPATCRRSRPWFGERPPRVGAAARLSRSTRRAGQHRTFSDRRGTSR